MRRTSAGRSRDSSQSKKPDTCTGCRLKRNGSMPAAPGAQRATHSAIQRRASETTHGGAPIRTGRLIPSERRDRMRGGFTTCTGTYGSGVQIGMDVTTTANRVQATRTARPPDARVCCGVARGPAPSPATSGLRPASAASRASAPATAGFAWPGLLALDPLLLYPLPASEASGRAVLGMAPAGCVAVAACRAAPAPRTGVQGRASRLQPTDCLPPALAGGKGLPPHDSSRLQPGFSAGLQTPGVG